MNIDTIDVPVYLNFFNRPETFKHVFNTIRQVKPSKLFLSCDGPRENRPDDIEKINKCKEIAELVDWNCEVYRNYSKINLGCGMRMYSGISWAFTYVDRLVIFEDDCVPAKDFFWFCKELLEKYKDDQRISMISAMNHLEKYNAPNSDYFFGPGCCWGWATWKRVWDDMDYQMNFFDDSYAMECIEHLFPYYTDARKVGNERRKTLQLTGKLTSWTYQAGMSAALNNQMSIIPTVNLVTNIGLTADSEHAVNNIKKLPKRIQAYFNMPIFSLKFPLNHPKYVIEDRMYYQMVQKKFKINKFTVIEGWIRRIIFSEKGDIKKLCKKVIKKLNRRIKT